MATNKEEHLLELQKFLLCPICKNVFTSASATLTCFHSFCTDCLCSKVQRVERNGQECIYCPECACFNTVKAPFKIIQDIAQLYHETVEDKKICHYCEDEGTAACWMCLTCKIKLCDDHKKYHEKTPNCTMHQYKPWSETEEIVVDKVFYCSDHKGEAIHDYCSNCNRGICCKCKLTSHAKHNTETLGKMFKRYALNVKGPIEAIESSVNTLHEEEAYFKRELARIDNIFESMKAEYNDTKERIIAHIEQQHATGIESLDEHKEKHIAEITQAIAERNHKRAARQQLINTAEIVRKTSRGCSFLEGFLGGVLQKVAKDSKEIPPLQEVIVTQPACAQGEMVQGQEVTMGNISYEEAKLSLVVPWQARSPKVHIDRVLQRLTGPTEVAVLEGNPQRLAFIEDDIWIANYDTSMGYQVFSILGNLLESRHPTGNPQLGSIYAFHQTSKQEVVAACTNGLFSMNPDGRVMHQIAQGMFSGVTSLGNVMAAIERKNSGYVEVFISNNNKWNLSYQFPLENTSTYFETVHILDNSIYVCFLSGMVCKYELTGKLVGRYGSTSGPATNQFYDPYICGSDARQSLIVCDSYNHRIQLKTADGKWYMHNLQGSVEYPKDVLVLRDCVFVLCGWFPRKLVKIRF